MKNRMRIICVMLISGLGWLPAHAQDGTSAEKKSDRKERRDPETLGDGLDRAFRNLERSLKQAGREVEHSLESLDENFWQDFGQEMAGLGEEIAGATREATRGLSGRDWNRNGHENAAYADEKTKRFSKTFRLAANDRLSIENKFGKVHVNTWDKPDATVEVVMVARAASAEKAQNLLDRISIVVGESDGETSVRTQMESTNNWNGKSQSFEINYTVNMPRNNALKVKNSFGDTYVADMNARSDLQVSYGNLKAERLSHADNYVKVAFGNGRIAYCKGGDLKVSYSDMEISECGAMNVESSFSDLEIGNVQSAKVRAKYGSLKMGTSGKNFRLFDIDGSFSDIDLRIPAQLGFDFDIRMSYADLDMNDSNAKFVSVEKSGTSKTYIGSIGKPSDGKIKINSRYGDVDFKVRE